MSWSVLEDTIVRDYATRKSWRRWQECSEKLFLLGFTRTQRACRQRAFRLGVINDAPPCKQAWSPREIELLEQFALEGRKLRDILVRFPQRDKGAIADRYYKIRKKMKAAKATFEAAGLGGRNTQLL